MSRIQMQWISWEIERLIRDAWNSPVSFLPNEETLTEIALIELHRRVPEIWIVEKPTKHEESRGGHDWVWTIGREQRYVTMRVQAKKLDHTGEYSQLKHEYKPKKDDSEDDSPKEFQIDRLLAAASRLKQFPAYVMYNGEFGVFKESMVSMGLCCNSPLKRTEPWSGEFRKLFGNPALLGLMTTMQKDDSLLEILAGLRQSSTGYDPLKSFPEGKPWNDVDSPLGVTLVDAEWVGKVMLRDPSGIKHVPSATEVNKAGLPWECIFCPKSKGRSSSEHDDIAAGGDNEETFQSRLLDLLRALFEGAPEGSEPVGFSTEEPEWVKTLTSGSDPDGESPLDEESLFFRPEPTLAPEDLPQRYVYLNLDPERQFRSGYPHLDRLGY